MANNFTPPSTTFCILPWTHLSTRPDGQIRLCCTSNASAAGAAAVTSAHRQIGVIHDNNGKPSNLNTSDLLSSWNSEYMKTVRKQMLAGEIPPSCSKCFTEESAGHASKRQWETAYWESRLNVTELLQNTDQDGSVPPHIAYVDLRFGNKCQLACVMCGPHDSSSWIKEWKAIHPTLSNINVKNEWSWNNNGSSHGSSYNWHKNNPVFWEQFWDQLPNIQQLYFAGGESLIINEHYTILEECISRGVAKNIELRYNSNGIEWRPDLFVLWEQFKSVKFHFSVDSIYEMNDYIRYPSSWERITEVFRILDTETSNNVTVSIACAVNALNVYYLPDFIKWKLAQKFTKVGMWPISAVGINYHLVYLPPFLNVKVLPNWFKEICTSKYERFFPWLEENWELSLPEHKKGKVSFTQWQQSSSGINRLKGLISFTQSDDWSIRLPEMKDYLEKLDAHRGTNFYLCFPDMKDIFNE